MKKYIAYLIILLALSSIFVSCSDFMRVDSNTTVNDMLAKKDTVYPLFGILEKFQKLADNYVVLGELRGDLLSTTANADPNLRQIENYDVQSNNPYADVTPYYAVINNCNQILVDTTYKKSTKYRYEYASIALIRAWTYLQLGINYNKAVYLQQPILNVADIAATRSSMVSFDQLIDNLISDVTSVSASSATRPTYAVPYSCPQANFVLGELYMWKATLTQQKEIGESTADSLKTSKTYYQTAAGYYKSIIQNDGSLSSDQNMYKVGTLFGGYAWSNIFMYTRSTADLAKEVMWMIIFDQNSGNSNNLMNLFSRDSKLKPSDYITNLWDIQKLSTGRIGDTRGRNVSWFPINSGGVVAKYSYNKTQFSDNAEVYLARAGLVYLRYAEAVNRCGKPVLALTALKYGLSKINLTTYVPASEKTPVATYINFDDVRYDNSRGIRGRVLLDPNTLIIPVFKFDPTNPTRSKSDSINFVEDAILQEYALETAFEGNRWADCMRTAMRRDNSGDYMYYQIGQKLGLGSAAEKLKDQHNWFLPLPTNN